MDTENNVKGRHAALYLRPAIIEHFRALVKQHILKEQKLEQEASEKFTTSFLKEYGFTLWPENPAKRRHLFKDGFGGPVYECVALSDAQRREKSGFLLYTRSAADKVTVNRNTSKWKDAKIVAESQWPHLSSSDQAEWADKAESTQGFHGPAHERRISEPKLDSPLAALMGSYFAVVLSYPRAQTVIDKPGQLVADILARTQRDAGVSSDEAEIDGKAVDSPMEEIAELEAGRCKVRLSLSLVPEDLAGFLKYTDLWPSHDKHVADSSALLSLP